MKIALGTVQFGMKYGVNGRDQRVTLEETANILSVARKRGITVLDTAIAYGDAEQRLGEIGIEGFRVVTKLPPDLGKNTAGKDDIVSEVRGSLQRLNISKLDGLLVHRADQLLNAGGSSVWHGLLEAREAGMVEKIGVSAATPDEIDQVLDRFEVDLIQLPFNLMDQRLISSGLSNRLKDGGIEIHTRSAFLQGLLLMAPETRPEYFQKWSTEFDAYDSWIENSTASRLQTSLNWCLCQSKIDHVLVGCETVEQLNEILDVADSGATKFPTDLVSEDSALINPAEWKIQ